MYQLGNSESNDKQPTRTLHKRPASRPRHKNQGLADCADLKIYSWSQLSEIVMSCFLEGWHTKCTLAIQIINLKNLNKKRANSEKPNV